MASESRSHRSARAVCNINAISLATIIRDMSLCRGALWEKVDVADIIAARVRAEVELGACGGDNYIETVWGRGYVLRDPDEAQQAA